MKNNIVLWTLVINGYLILVFLIIKLVKARLANGHPLVRIISLSFIYALFLGVGIVGSGGDPGFGFPAPNIVAIILMLTIGYFNGVINGIVLIIIWWGILFISMFIGSFIPSNYQNMVNPKN
ncbi:MAG: hypothetical protein DWQ02_25430 [Bacteroidetes bacterium]|nr:MAG: hypothetical protein DWQ02_25430 [Bacteroidota bacterium]